MGLKVDETPNGCTKGVKVDKRGVCLKKAHKVMKVRRVHVMDRFPPFLLFANSASFTHQRYGRTELLDIQETVT